MTRLSLHTTAEFRRGYKRARKRGQDTSRLWEVIGRLLEREPLAASHRDHALAGAYRGFRECHVEPYWLLVYAVDENRLVLTAAATGSHSDLF